MFQKLTIDSPPLSARLRSYADSTYAFFGLYVTTLFSVRWIYIGQGKLNSSTNKLRCIA